MGSATKWIKRNMRLKKYGIRTSHKKLKAYLNNYIGDDYDFYGEGEIKDVEKKKE